MTHFDSWIWFVRPVFSSREVVKAFSKSVQQVLHRASARRAGRMPAQWAMSSAAAVAAQPQQGAKDVSAKGRADEARGSVVSVSAEALSSPSNKRSSINLFINQQIEHLRAATEVLLYRHTQAGVSRAPPSVLGT